MLIYAWCIVAVLSVFIEENLCQKFSASDRFIRSTTTPTSKFSDDNEESPTTTTTKTTTMNIFDERNRRLLALRGPGDDDPSVTAAPRSTKRVPGPPGIRPFEALKTDKERRELQELLLRRWALNERWRRLSHIRVTTTAAPEQQTQTPKPDDDSDHGKKPQELEVRDENKE